MGSKINETTKGEPSNYALGLRFQGFHNVKRIQKLHPKITKVNLLAKTYCEVYFASELDQTEAQSDFQKLVDKKQVKDVKIVNVAKSLANVADHNNFKSALNRLIGNIEKVNHGYSTRKVTDGVFIRDLPRDITEDEIRTLFPDALNVTVLVPRQPTKGAGVSLTMPSPSDALKVRQQKKLMIRGIKYKPEFQRDGMLTVRHAKRLARRGHFVEAPSKRTEQPPRYFMEPGVEVKEEKLKPEEVESYMKIYD